MRQGALLIIAGLLVISAGCTGIVDPASESTTTPASDSTDTPATQATNGTLEVHYLNVGQGSATLVVTPTNRTILVDSGDWRDDGEGILASLQRRDVTHLDYLVTSHADADHIGGHAAVIDYFETEADGIGAVYDPGIAASSQTYEAYLDAVERHNVTLYRAQAGDALDLPAANATILAPPAGYLAGEDRNENSLVLRLRYGATSFLFPGDAAEQGEDYLTETYDAALNVTVLQAGHHGSKTSTGRALLDAATLRMVVISSAYDSQYGHPHTEVLQRLADRAIPTYWTATHGNIVLTSDGQTVTVATQQVAPTDADRLREGTPIDPETSSAVEVRTRFTVSGDEPGSTATATATDGGTETPTPTPSGGNLELANVHADAEGDDRENLNDEYIVLENTGDDPLALGSWRVADAAGHTYTVPDGVVLDPGKSLILHTGSGTDTETDIYWGSEQPVWNNGGDTVTVTSDAGKRVLEETY